MDTAVQAYVLGFIAADGSVRPYEAGRRGASLSIEIAERDISLLCFLRDELAPLASLHRRIRPATTAVSFTVNSERLVSDLARWGVVPRKSKVLRWPAELPPHLAGSFLHGYSDGDGWVTRKNGGRWEWGCSSGSPEFLLDVATRIQQALGFRLRVTTVFGSNCYRVGTGRKPWLAALDQWLQADGLGLARKRIFS